LPNPDHSEILPFHRSRVNINLAKAAMAAWPASNSLRRNVVLMAMVLGDNLGIMQLSKWLKRHGKTQAELAKAVSVGPPTICKILSGKRTPSRRLITAIYEYTDKQVGLEDWARAEDARIE
jgi:DNA-binding XRE family transcriptional regulator